MRRTNLLLEVSDEVYFQLVEPMKKNKSFTKLVVSLLNGYIRDGYIHSYVEDTLEESRRAAVTRLNDAFADMEALVAKMGMTADEIGATAEAGQQHFSKKRGEAAEELNSRDAGLHGSSAAGADTPKAEPSNEYKDLSDRVDGLERTINDNFEALFKFMQSMGAKVQTDFESQSSGISETNKTSSQPTKAVATPPVQVVEPTKPTVVSDVVRSNEESSADRVKATAALAMQQAVKGLSSEVSEEGSNENGLTVKEGFLNSLFTDVGMNF